MEGGVLMREVPLSESFAGPTVFPTWLPLPSEEGATLNGGKDLRICEYRIRTWVRAGNSENARKSG